ncbi:hypothetical protein [Bacillus sinesaloumensis]|uniref:hypothetical protein n=1 Tax=Litchfieldia sinesaloumensis TaxID=1926280 RepID=UPI00098891BE|nr:hypothetical protein [Bacillus sinesaloumensis]
MNNQNEMPHEEGIDHSLGFLKDGYEFILKRRKELQSDIFETRMFGMKVICMGGSEAAELFYDTEKFQRKNVAPNRIVQTLFGKNAIQTLDGKQHRWRKQLFMSILSGEQLSNLIKLVEAQWEIAINKWEQKEQIVLYEEVKLLLCKAVFEWTGVPIKENQTEEFTEELAALYESAAKVGPKHWQGRTARNHAEQYVEDVIEGVRGGKITPPK